MKGKILKRVLAASLVLTFVSGTVPAQPIADIFGSMSITANAANGSLSGDGSQENPFLIEDADDWTTFAESINNGTTFSNQYIKLINNITITEMTGDATHPFSGTLDGDGYTITFNSDSSTDGCAPFYQIDGATFINLTVAGTINSSSTRSAGVAAYANGSSTFSRCRSKININPTKRGACFHAGFVSDAYSNSAYISFVDSIFEGSVSGTSSNYNICGFVAKDNQNYVTFSNCLFNPTSMNSGGNGCNPFSMNA